MTSFDADVIVVGAGPAGSLAAYTIAKAGFKVIVLEKEQFPRYKVCGAGLTYKIIREIPFDISPVIETEITSVRFSTCFSDVFTRTSEVPLMYCTMRTQLDEYLISKAVECGAVVVYNSHVKEINKLPEGYLVSSGDKKYSCRMIIGADGAAGIVSRSFKLKKNIEKGLAWEAEVSVGKEILEKYRSTVFLDWGTFPGGYGWIFPKKDHFSVGVGGPASLSAHMMDYYIQFLTSSGCFEIPAELKNPEDVPGTKSLKAWPIPVMTKKGNFHSGNVMITGDAAGLSDPLTGEGIFYAVRSGLLAGEAAADFLKGDKSACEKYSAKVNTELMTELIEAYRIRHIFNAFPKKIHHFVRDSERAWRAFGKVLRGERMYADVRNGFGKWKNAWNIISYVSGISEKFKEKKFLKQGIRR